MIQLHTMCACMEKLVDYIMLSYWGKPRIIIHKPLQVLTPVASSVELMHDTKLDKLRVILILLLMNAHGATLTATLQAR